MERCDCDIRGRCSAPAQALKWRRAKTTISRSPICLLHRLQKVCSQQQRPNLPARPAAGFAIRSDLAMETELRHTDQLRQGSGKEFDLSKRPLPTKTTPSSA